MLSAGLPRTLHQRANEGSEAMLRANRRFLTCGAALAAFILGASAAQAGVSAAEAAKLGKELTEVGAERAGNKEGTIPAWVGRESFAPEMLKITRQNLEDLRVRLVKDIQQMLTDPAVT